MGSVSPADVAVDVPGDDDAGVTEELETLDWRVRRAAAAQSGGEGDNTARPRRIRLGHSELAGDAGECAAYRSNLASRSMPAKCEASAAKTAASSSHAVVIALADLGHDGFNAVPGDGVSASCSFSDSA